MQNMQYNLESFAYELIPKMTRKNQFCSAIAINQNNKIVIVEERGKIKVFNLSNEALKLIQIIQLFGYSINTINFFKQQQFIVIASCMGDIIFRSSILQSNQKFLMKIKDNITSINCLLLNSPQEDLIITGSNDYAIRFYQSKQLSSMCWKCSQTITEHLNKVQGLSLNQEGTKLISCGSDLKIIIMEGSNKNKWIVKQKIQTESIGFRINFITNDTFIFQEKSYYLLSYYIFNSKQGQFYRYRKFQVEGSQQSCYNLFPAIYLNQKQLLLLKNGKYLNLIRFINSPSGSQDFEFTLIQTIHFDTGQIFGTLSEDGQFLITWDHNSYEIQVRKPKKIV
ncbi:unnamed protein product [Paramecium sonneborni]|uniref:WD40-repeat-containing domain n=1 Tax=Paramecium sonneborni TaxID=65129 RepID=A0A8S1PF53_9CILI|nr:unnamed protein product [Paramecium sonneborni]